MIYNYIDESILTDIADAIREVNGKSVKYKPKDMANAIRGLVSTTKPLYPFDTATDEQLAEMVTAYYNGDITLDDVKSVWAVGDKRKISLSAMAATGVGETHVAQEQEIVILDFDHDTLATQVNSITKALISVQPLRVLSGGTTLEGGYMNSSNTNSGGWNSAARHTWCNNVFKAALPSYIQNLVKQVTKPYCATYNNATISNVNDYVWLLSENEVFGKKSYSPAQEGTQYEYYKTTSNRIKYSGNASTKGSAQHWWERSPLSGNTIYFCFVYSDGTASYYNASGTSGLAPAFCI
jgi:hypothetical protein